MRHNHHPRAILIRLFAALPLLLVAVLPTLGALATPPGVEAAASCPKGKPVPNAADFQDRDGEPNDIDNPYLPLVPGSVLTYEGHKQDDLGNNQKMRDVFKVTNTVKIIHLSTGRVPVVQVLDQVWLDGEPAETTLDWFGQDRLGNVWYFGEDSTDFLAPPEERKHGSWEAGKDGAKPGVIMEARPRKGDFYLQENAPGVAVDKARVKGFVSSYTVPFGKFTNVLKTEEGSCLEPGLDNKYYARGIGNIKEESLGDDGKPDGVEELHLINFKKGND